MKLQLKYSGLPEREDRTPCPPLSGKVCGVDEAPVFPFLLREIGKPPMLILGAMMRKLVHVAFGILKSGKPFNPALHST